MKWPSVSQEDHTRPHTSLAVTLMQLKTVLTILPEEMKRKNISISFTTSHLFTEHVTVWSLQMLVIPVLAEFRQVLGIFCRELRELMFLKRKVCTKQWQEFVNCNKWKRITNTSSLLRWTGIILAFAAHHKIFFKKIIYSEYLKIILP